MKENCLQDRRSGLVQGLLPMQNNDDGNDDDNFHMKLSLQHNRRYHLRGPCI